MLGKKIQESSCQSPAHLITTVLQCPVSYVDRLLPGDQHTRGSSSSTNDFLLTMLDHLTDYILEMVGNDASTSSMHTVPQDERAVDNSRESHQHLKDAAFTLFDEMRGTRRNG
ncbi:huntingtin-interacting protein M [Crocuta crocuta]